MSAEPIGSLQAGALHTEKVLQQISEQVARLASAVNNISSALEERATHADLRAAGENNQANFSMIEQRLARLERAVTVRTPSSSSEENVAVGLHVARLYSQLEATNTELSRRATSTTLTEIEQDLSERLNKHAKIVTRERASQEQMARLEQAHDALSSQVAAVEAACANKIDTARLAGFETTVSRLRDFASFRTTSEDRLATLEEEASNLHRSLLQRAAAAQEVENMVGRMRQRLHDDTPRNNDLLALQDKVRTGRRTTKTFFFVLSLIFFVCCYRYIYCIFEDLSYQLLDALTHHVLFVFIYIYINIYICFCSLAQFQRVLEETVDKTSDSIQTNLLEHMTNMSELFQDTSRVQSEKLEEHHLLLVKHDDDILQRATIQDVSVKTNSTEHEQLESYVREGLKRRAAVRTVRTVQKDVEHLIKKTEYLEKVSNISQRFMEWFHNRGSAYEQNCQTIERQLNTLVVGSDPRVRQPFVNQVRMDDVGEVANDIDVHEVGEVISESATKTTA
jgi:hypothetical protein